MTLRIRRARPEDARAVVVCRRAAVYAKAPSFYEPAEIASWVPRVTDDHVRMMRQELESPATIALVALDNQLLVGFGVLMPQDQTLKRLYVRPNHVGGVGTALLREIEIKAAAYGCPHIELIGTLNARDFYQRNGYRLCCIGRWPVGGPKRLRGLMLRKPLVPRAVSALVCV